MNYHIGIDLGATSGRVVLGNIEGDQVCIEILHRFDNHLTSLRGHVWWDICAIWREILEGCRKAAQKGVNIVSIGVDTWGVDVVLVGKDGNILSQPIAYRDPYTTGVPEHVFQEMSREEIYAITGIQTMNFNTLFQLRAMRDERMTAFQQAHKILFMPDAISYLLSGEQVCEYTILSTSQLINARTRQLDDRLLQLAGVTREQFGRPVMPGEKIGTLTPEIQALTGLGAIDVIAVAGHDTASAVAAVPHRDESYAYLSSGTWSLMGVVSTEPILTPEAAAANFTNEGGVNGTIRFLKNITGMWLQEQCIAQWQREGKNYTYKQIESMAEKEINHYTITFPCREVVGFSSSPFIINPDDPSLANPTNMPSAIRALVKSQSQNLSPNKGGGGLELSDAQVMATIFLSLAHRYAEALNLLRQLTGKTITTLHIIGGGSQNDLLNRLTAQSTGVNIVLGPVEATVEGNIQIQHNHYEQGTRKNK